jgi:sigma-E factor negative regulatory protein RseA
MKSDNFSENLSLLVDDQLDLPAAVKLMKGLESNADDAAHFSRYLLVQEVLRSGKPVIEDSDFVSRVQLAVDDEPAILVPDWRKRVSDRAVTLALAATLAGLAVFVGGSVLQEREASPMAVAAIDPAASVQLHDYLVTHNETAYLAANGGLMPYLRVVSSDRSGR